MSLLLLLNPSTPRPPDQTRLWIPDTVPRPTWIERSPSALLVGRQLIEDGRLLSELAPRTFELLIGELLERDGWRVEVTRGTKDGGIDVVSIRDDPTLGRLKAIWQAKKYHEGHKVRLAHARELSALVDREGATKGILVTTSSLTGGALGWVRQDEFRLSAKDGPSMRRWILESVGEPA